MPAQPLNILLLEDSPIDAELVQHRIDASGLGWQVHHVTNGSDFRAALASDEQIDLVLSDYHLPDIDGMTALHESLARRPETPFIFVSGKLGEEAAVQSLQQGATDYVVKVRLDRLVPAVRRAIHEASERRARKRAEAALRDAQDRLHAALEASAVSTWVWDVTDDQIDGDANFTTHFPPARAGEARDLPPRRSLASFLDNIDAADRERCGSAIRATLEPGAERYSVDCRLCAAKGSPRWISLRGRIERDAEGRPVRMLSAVLDITDRKHLELEREQALEREQRARLEAENTNRLKDEFLATLSHELRTPLSAILGWSQILRRTAGGGQPEIATGLEVIERNARAQARLIEDLLDMSRIVSGSVRLNSERIDLRQVTQAAIDVAMPTAQARRVRLIGDLGDAPLTVMGDATRLQQVIWNLLSNAIKFTPPDGSVTVRLQAVATQAELTVADTGVGIDPAFLPFVFDRFRQADSSTTRVVGGLGLGLSIVKHLAELHGGSVAASSEGEGRGARFTVRLPLADATPATENLSPQGHGASSPSLPNGVPAVAGSASSATVDPLRGLNVLVVDDEPDARAVVKQVLELQGASVRVASSADEARSHLSDVRPDVLISDIGMPGEDGYQLVRSLRSPAGDGVDGASLLAIALSAFSRPTDRAQAKAAGFDAHLAKPIDADVLVASVATYAATGRVPHGPVSLNDEGMDVAG